MTQPAGTSTPSAGRIWVTVIVSAFLLGSGIAAGPVIQADAHVREVHAREVSAPMTDEPAITDITLDGALRAGEGFLQILRADVDGDVPVGTLPIVEPVTASNPGTIRVSRLEITDDSRITGIVRQASTPGTYVLTMCLVAKPTATCASALASRVFSIVVAGPPTQLDLISRDDRVNAGEATRLAVAALDSDGDRTQLSGEESLELEARADRGSVGVDGLAEAIDRMRDGLGATLEATVVWPDDHATVTLSAIGFDATPVSTILETRSLPGKVVVLPDAPVVLAGTNSSASIRGRVIGSAGEGLSGVTVSGVVTGSTTARTSTDVTGPSGRFRIDYATADARTDSRDLVTISADAAALGVSTADLEVVLSANGRTPLSSLMFNGVPAVTMQDPIPVVYDGYAIGEVDAIRVTARAEVPGSEVMFRSSRGWLSATDGTLWNAGRHQISVSSDPVNGIATAFLFTTTPGDVDVAAIGASTLTGDATFRTRPPAARNLRLSSSTTRMRTGQRVRLVTAVTDVFGTPVPEAQIDLVISGVGAFDTGSRRITMVTDGSGRVDIYASASTAGSMTITATGRAARCVRGENQYQCARNEPAPGFAAASGSASTRVTVTAFRPTLKVVAPTMNERVSYNEWVRVRATTTDIRPGTRAQLRSGARLLASAKVLVSGRIEFPPVHAQGRGTLSVTVAGVKVTTQVSVTNFGITSVRRAQGSLIIGVVTGVWQPPTRIMLTRNGSVVSSQRVVAKSRPMSFSVPERRGNYQVRVVSRFGPVLGRTPRFVP